MAHITISDSRNDEAYIFFDKNGTINISTEKMDEVLVIKSKRGKLYMETEKKTPADKLLEADCMRNSSRARKREGKERK